MQQIYDTSLMHNNVSHYAKTQFFVQKFGNEKKDIDIVQKMSEKWRSNELTY